LQDLTLQSNLSAEFASVFTDERRASLFKSIYLLHNVSRGYITNCFVNVYYFQLPTEVVVAVATNCYNLVKLYLHSYCKDDDTIINSIAGNCPNLELLCLNNLTDFDICEIATHCNNLTCLICKYGDQSKLTDKSVTALAGNCPHFEQLTVPKFHKITAGAIKHMKVCI